MSEQATAQFVLQRIYVRDVSFESPQAPAGFRTQWKPKVNLELNSRHVTLEEDLYEVILNVTVTSKGEDDEVMYLVEVQQAGIFMIKGLDEVSKLQTLCSYCPNVLFPYARETIDSIVIKGSFPPLMLGPVNFESIYQQTQAERARQQDQVQ